MSRYQVLKATLEGVAPENSYDLPALDRVAAPWESSMQATCECLSWRGALDNLERRHAEDDMGATDYSAFPVHTRSAVVCAHLLLDKGVITQDELAAKMTEIRRRLADA